MIYKWFKSYLSERIPPAVTSTLLLYADDSCIPYQHKDFVEIEKQFNVAFENLCDWFADNKF